MSEIRLFTHSVYVETGRYTQQRIDRSQRYCTFCNSQDIDDEFHFEITCPIYEHIRKTLYQIVLYKKTKHANLVKLMTSCNRTVI